MTGSFFRKKTILLHLHDIAFFIYTCAVCAHQLGEGFDAIFVRSTFVVYFCIVAFSFFETRRIKFVPYTIWYVAFIGYILLSCFWANSKYSFAYINQFIQNLVVIIGLSQRIKNKEDVQSILKLVLFSYIYMVILLVIKTPSSQWGTEDIGSAIGLWRNDLGMRVATATMISMYFLFTTKSILGKILYVLLFAVATFVALASGSRKALMMVVIGLVGYFLIYKKRKITPENIIKFIFGFAVIIAVVVGIFYLILNIPFFQQLIGKRFESMMDVFFDNSQEASLGEREFFIEKARQLFEKHPFFGAGSNGFVSYMHEINYSHQAYCHNNFWELLCTLGVVGFSIYYGMSLYCLVKTMPWRKINDSQRSLSAILFIILAITVVLGWWNVYYFSEITNTLMSIIYMYVFINKKNRQTVFAAKTASLDLGRATM